MSKLVSVLFIVLEYNINQVHLLPFRRIELISPSPELINGCLLTVFFKLVFKNYKKNFFLAKITVFLYTTRKLEIQSYWSERSDLQKI